MYADDTQIDVLSTAQQLNKISVISVKIHYVRLIGYNTVFSEYCVQRMSEF